MEVKDHLKGEPISYSLEKNLRESLSPSLKIKKITRSDNTFDVILESAGKEYKLAAIKANVVKDQWQFILGGLNTFSKKKLIESILRDSQPLENRNTIAQSILKEMERSKVVEEFIKIHIEDEYKVLQSEALYAFILKKWNQARKEFGSSSDMANLDLLDEHWSNEDLDYLIKNRIILQKKVEDEDSLIDNILEESFDYETSEAYTPIFNKLLDRGKEQGLQGKECLAYAKKEFVKEYGLLDYQKYVGQFLQEGITNQKVIDELRADIKAAKDSGDNERADKLTNQLFYLTGGTGKVSLKEKREMSWPIPTAADESYVMLILAIGCAKRSLPNLNTLAYFEDKDEQSMVDEGLKVIEGKITAEAYAKKFFTFVKKYNKDKVDPQDEAIILSQVEARVGRNKSDIVNPNMKKAAKKESVLKEGVLTTDEEDLLANMDNNINLDSLSEKNSTIASSLEGKGYLKLVSSGHLEFYKKTDKTKQYLGENE